MRLVGKLIGTNIQYTFWTDLDFSNTKDYIVLI